MNLRLSPANPVMTSEELDRLLSDDTDVSATDTISHDIIVSATDGRGKYQNEWKKEHKDTIRFDVSKGMKRISQTEATTRGISITQLVKSALTEYLGREIE